MTLSTDAITPLSEATSGARDAADDATRARESVVAADADLNPSSSVMRIFAEPTPVSLATLQRDGVHFNAGEAVAIGQALCLALMTAQFRRRHDADTDVASVLRPLNTETVLLDPTSRLGVSADDPGDEATAIHYVGRVLADIAPGDTRRTIEAKIIAKALATPPRFGSIAELSHALAKFEKPQGRELIQRVYERWQRGERTSEGSAQAMPCADARPNPRIRFGSPPKAVAAALIVVAFVIVGIGATFLITPITRTVDTAVTVGSPTLLESRSTAPVTSALVAWSVARAEPPTLSTGVAAATRDHLPGRVPRLPAVERMKSPAPLPLSQSKPRDKSPAPLAIPMLRPNVVSPTAPPASAPSNSDLGAGRGSNNAVLSRNEVAAAISSPEAVKTVPANYGSSPLASTAIYTARDLDVVPPIPILPRLLAALQPSSPGVRLDALVIAVVVDEQGRASSVSGLTQPQSMGEFMLLTSALAAVKQWEFDPALKDGVPVRYRLVVPFRSVTQQTQ